MDAPSFDALTRTLGRVPSRRRLVALALGSLVAVRAAPASAKKKKKVTLCHEGQTLSVSKKAKKAHLAHGDALGACPPASPPPPPPPPTPPAPPADVCQGRDVCAQGSAAACGPAGNECYCWVTAAGAPYCGGNDSAIAAQNCTACAAMGRVCVRGGGTYCEGPFVCVLPCCPPGFRDCGEKCVDVLRDAKNCGRCGRDCGIDRPNICAGGSCCADAGGRSPCSCAPAGSACAAVGDACCATGSCTNGVCP